MQEQSLKYKMITGIVWTAFQKGGALIIGFIGNIILARLLSPDDYGCIGLLLIFTSIADILIDGGLGVALIQKKEIKDIYCSTVFTTNLFISIGLFCLLFLLAPNISRYFDIPILRPMLRIECIVIMLQALYIIPSALLNRALSFKKLAIITISSNIISVVFAVICAYGGLGVWSLVIKNIVLQCSLCLLYWFNGNWKMNFKFSFKSFKVLFKYGSLVGLSNLVESIFANVESFVIGRCYTAKTLGYYSQAKSLGQIPIYSISMVVNQVLFPVLSKLQDQNSALVHSTRKSLIAITYIAFPLITLLCILSKPVIILLYSEKWAPAIPFLQLVCIAGLINSVIHTNFSVLKSVGCGNLFLFSQVVINFIKLLLMIIGIKFGVMGVLGGHVVGNYIGSGILSFLSGRTIGYGLKKQMLDLFPSFFLSIFLGLVLYLIMSQLAIGHILTILVVSIVFGMTYLVFSGIFAFEGFKIYKEIIKTRYLKA